MTYVTSALIQLATQPLFTIKQRGLTPAIPIDVAQVVLKKTHLAFQLGVVTIVSEPLLSSVGRTRDVSTIDISIKRTAA